MAIISEVVKSESYSPACDAAYGVHVFLKEAKPHTNIERQNTRKWIYILDKNTTESNMCLDQKDTIRKF